MERTKTKHHTGWNFDHSYRNLPASFFHVQLPVPVRQPQLVLLNKQLATTLGLDFAQTTAEEIAQQLAGNQVPEGAAPLAQAYAGHQFGHFNMLGDGRAILLGEQLSPSGQRWDIQLKGSGRTPFSRGGDGRATLSAMLREYLISEAMHHLSIPTTRSLAVVKTGEPVYRERSYPGAVLTRVAQSHIRGGTFEFARHFLERSELQELTHYVIQRHYPALSEVENPALALLRAVMERQTDLVVHWMRVGFIHGVMNTDNMSIAGETIDYGPCAFMNAYSLRTVFSSIDTGGRYAYGHQPGIVQWNLGVLAGALLPLIDEQEEQAIAQARAVLDEFPDLYTRRWLHMMGAKLGLANAGSSDMPLINELLRWMQSNEADYTNTFVYLMQGSWPAGSIYETPAFVDWHAKWQARLQQENTTPTEQHQRMQQHNPCFIPRNHLVEEALAAASEQDDWSILETLLQVWSKPYEPQAAYAHLQAAPAQVDATYRTYCGT